MKMSEEDYLLANDTYTFYEYLIDHNILSKEALDGPAGIKHTLVMYDLHQEEYEKYCEDNNLEYETIDS